MKWYNFETMFTSLKEDLRKYLKENNIKYELSGGPGFYHFEIYANNTLVNQINDFIDSVTITSK